MILTLRRVLILIVAAILFAVGFWFFAPYNVAASVKHFPPVRWMLHSYMKNAVRNRAILIDPPAWFDASDPALQRLGAGHFATGCATCHGAPGMPRNAVVRSMLPEPTLLDKAMEYSPREFYWIARHGLKYTGMPAWAGQHRDDEPWAMAAFMSSYATLEPETYRAMAYGNPDALPGQSAVSFGGTTSDWPENPAAACTRCHGRDGLGRDGTAPKLAGQSAAYLESALDAYAEDRRQSGFMEPLAIALTPAARQEMARHFAAMEPARWTGETGEAWQDGDVARGRELAFEGDEHAEIPSCVSCHGSGDRPPRNPEIPRIAGQDARWIAVWLKQWRDGPVPDVTGADRMAAAAEELDDADIADLAAYYAAAGSGPASDKEPAGR